MPGINYSNWKVTHDDHTLNEVIRSFIISYGIAFGTYDAITRCYNCRKLILPKTKFHRSFCSKSCRSENHKIEFGRDKYACFERQKKWYSYYIKNKHGQNIYATIETDKCKDCERFWEFEKIPGGLCDVFSKVYGVENIKKNKWVHEQEVKLAQKNAEEEKSFAEEFYKLKANK